MPIQFRRIFNCFEYNLDVYSIVLNIVWLECVGCRIELNIEINVEMSYCKCSLSWIQNCVEYRMSLI